jgi:hypothetical protein
MPPISRRNFLKATGLAGIVAGIAGEDMFTRMAFGATPYGAMCWCCRCAVGSTAQRDRSRIGRRLQRLRGAAAEHQDPVGS